jgi:ribosomal protein S12 methylthiotransferase accessory factor
MNNQMTVSFPGGRQVAAHYNGFAILTDQGTDSGGDGAAPEPYDLFLASIATCAGYYVLRFCSERNLPVDGLKVVQSWQRDERKRLSHILLQIEVPPEFPEKYRPALVRAADICAVKRTLQDPPEIVTETVVRSSAP